MSGPEKRAREEEAGAAASAARAPPPPPRRRHRAALLVLLARRHYGDWPVDERPLMDCLDPADMRALKAALTSRRPRTALLMLMARRCYKAWPFPKRPLLDCLSVVDARALPAAFAADPPTLLDVAWIVAKNGYAADVWRCCGLCREMLRWIAPGMCAEDAARVRRDHPFWQAIINLPHCLRGETRLMLAAMYGKLARVETLIAWHADVNAVDKNGVTALMYASANNCHAKVVRVLLASGAVVDAVSNAGDTALIHASFNGHVEVVRALLAAGANKHIIANNRDTANSVAGRHHPDLTAAIRELLALAP